MARSLRNNVRGSAVHDVWKVGEKGAGGISSITPRSWLFLILSGLATGASWLCYFYAIKIGDVSKVVPIDKCSLILTIVFAVIFLGEAVSWKTIVGGVLLLVGTLVMVL